MVEDDATVTSNAFLLPLRLAMGAIFIVAGYQKLTNLDGTASFFDSVGIPAAGFFALIVGTVEFFGGLGILSGVLTRISGAFLAINMAVAITMVTWAGGGWDGSRLEIMLLCSGLTFVATGAGRWSLPALLNKPELDPETKLMRLVFR